MAGPKMPSRVCRPRSECRLAPLVLAIWFASFSDARSADPGRGPPTDTGPPTRPAPQTNDSPSNSLKNRSSSPLPPKIEPSVADDWHRSLNRERQLEVRLRSAREELNAGRLIPGLTLLQGILDREDDLFVRIENESAPHGAHWYASQILDSLSTAGRNIYENLYGAEARRLLGKNKSPDPRHLENLVRRFYHTQAGFEAGCRLAAYWSDRGQDELALCWWRRAMRDSAATERLTAAHRLQAAVTERRVGSLSNSPSLFFPNSANPQIVIAGRPLSVAAARHVVENWPLDRSEIDQAAQKRQFAARNPQFKTAISKLGIPVWRNSLASDESRHLESLAKNWIRCQIVNGLPIGTPQSAVVIDNQLVYRDFEGLRSVNVASGETFGFVPSPTSLAREISPRQTTPIDGNPDPNNVMRLVTGNSAAKSLSTNGRLVFAIEPAEPDDTVDGRPPIADPNAPALLELLQLSAWRKWDRGDQRSAIWCVGGFSSAAAPALRQHTILGAPLCVGELLFVVSESQQQIWLSCLKAESGSLFWTQNLCSVSQPVQGDLLRNGFACCASYADGIVVCPTQNGLLVAVDVLTGTLIWASSHDDDDSPRRQQSTAGTYQSRRLAAQGAYLKQPLIHGGRVFYLPTSSEYLHCTDLMSGRLVWRVRRDDFESATATDYAACVSDNTLLVVSRRRCRGLNVANGGELWQRRFGSTPSGHGILIDNQYLTPFDDGSVQAIDLESGKMEIVGNTADGAPLGNLLIAGDKLVSISSFEVRAFSTLNVQPTESEKSREDSTSDRRGDAYVRPRKQVNRDLENLIVVNDDPSREISSTVVEGARIASRVHTDDSKSIPADGRAVHVVKRASMSIEQHVRQRGFANSPDDWRGDEECLNLARRLISRGNQQQAETLLLNCRQNAQEAISATATRLLAELWEGAELPRDALRMRLDLTQRLAVAPLESSGRGKEQLRMLHSHDPTPIRNVEIVELRCTNEALQQIYNSQGAQLLLTPRSSPFDLLDRGRGVNGVFSVVNRMTGAEYPEAIQIPGRLYYPVGTHIASHSLQHSYVGNLIPLGGIGTLHGMSLLERRLAWSTAPDALKEIREIVRVGPSGPGFCTFQVRQHLFVLDPFDGKILWHRSDLEANAGLMHDSFLGMIGDQQVLTVFATNGANYTLYDTATGTELRRGKLDVNPRLPRRAVGRRLFHFTAKEHPPKVRVWDPLDNKTTWEESTDNLADASLFEGIPPGTKLLTFVRDLDEAVLLTTTNIVRIVNLIDGKTKLELSLPPEQLENASVLRAFRDRDRYFVNVQRAHPPGRAPAQGTLLRMAVSDAVLPVAQIDGDLLAVDSKTQALLWRRTIGKRTLLQVPEISLPVLVSLSRIRRNDQSQLCIEAFDFQTGELRAERDDLFSDRLLQLQFDSAACEIKLLAANTVVTLRYQASSEQ